MSKTTWWVIGVIVVVGIIVIIWSRMKGGAGPTVEQPPPTTAIEETAPTKPVLPTLSFSVEGLTTENAKSKVEEAVKGVAGVTNVVSNLATNTLTVEYDPAVVSDVEALKADIKKAIEGAGFKVATETPAEPTPPGS